MCRMQTLSRGIYVHCVSWPSPNLLLPAYKSGFDNTTLFVVNTKKNEIVNFTTTTVVWGTLDCRKHIFYIMGVYIFFVRHRIFIRIRFH
jgi:hypothetical protein